jgi:hypothetical protein
LERLGLDKPACSARIRLKAGDYLSSCVHLGSRVDSVITKRGILYVNAIGWDISLEVWRTDGEWLDYWVTQKPTLIMAT